MMILFNKHKVIVTRFMLISLCLVFTINKVFAATLRVAVAANFAAPLKSLALGFERKTGHRIQIISGSSGKLYAQILQGAPFDVFLSADTIKPLALFNQGKASMPFTYARGQLVVFVNQRILPHNTAQETTQAFLLWLNCAFLNDPSKNHEPRTELLQTSKTNHAQTCQATKTIAIANPSFAPYGQAAQELLTDLMADDMGDFTEAKPNTLPAFVKLIVAENISQVAHYVKSGGVDVGFMAASLLPFKLNSDKTETASAQWQRVPNGWLWWPKVQSYSPIIQQGVILPSAQPELAQAFSDYLLSDEVQYQLQHQWHYLPLTSSMY